MCIDKTRKNNLAACVDNFCVGCVLLDFIAGSDAVDLSIANAHAAVANNREVGHLSANARPFRARQRDQLCSVKDRERVQEFKTTHQILNRRQQRKQRLCSPAGQNNKTSFALFASVKSAQPSLASTI